MQFKLSAILLVLVSLSTVDATRVWTFSDPHCRNNEERYEVDANSCLDVESEFRSFKIMSDRRDGQKITAFDFSNCLPTDDAKIGRVDVIGCHNTLIDWMCMSVISKDGLNGARSLGSGPHCGSTNRTGTPWKA